MAHLGGADTHVLTNLLDELLPDDQGRLLTLGRVHEIAAGAEITRQGTLGDCLFVVEAGELAIVRRVPGDEEKILDTAPAGTLVGEFAVLDRRPRSASLRARGSGRVSSTCVRSRR